MAESERLRQRKAVKIKKFSPQYRSETGHALASFASKRILSGKLRFSCFSQVPSGSDYPAFRPILPKILSHLDFLQPFFFVVFFIRKGEGFEPSPFLITFFPLILFSMPLLPDRW